MNRTSRDGDIANSESLYGALSWSTHHHSYWSADSDGIIMVDSPAKVMDLRWKQTTTTFSLDQLTIQFAIL